MNLTEETIRAVLVAALAQNTNQCVSEVIKDAVDALIAADRKLRAYSSEALGLNAENQTPTRDTEP